MTTFLVVDDDPDLRYLVSVAVKRWGHEAHLAQDLAEARRLCADERPDVLLLDVNMPGLDGPDFLGALRDEGLAPAHVYLLSALEHDELEALAGELDVGYIVKPFTVQSLRDDLAAVLGEDGPSPQ